MEHADEKRVLLCLLEVSRYAREVYIKPPDIISQEEEELVEGADVTETVTPTSEDNLGSNHDISHSIEPSTDDGDLFNCKPGAPTPESPPKAVDSGEGLKAEMVTPVSEDTEPALNNDIPHSIEPTSDDVSKPSIATARPPPKLSDDEAIGRNEDHRDNSPLLDYCSYPFFFSFLLLLLLLGGGIYLRRRK